MAKKIQMASMDDDGDETLPDLDTSKPLGGQANERINGKVDLPESGREIIKPIPLSLISRDPAQPRKAIPRTVSKAARASNIPEWQAWHRIAEQLSGQTIDLKRLLRGEGEAPDKDSETKPHELVRGFLALVGLATSIARDKQTNAITIVRIPGMSEAYEIETGERRWHAHLMLYDVLKRETFSKIKAKIVDQASVWRQATENTVREDLTAIGKARQLALLLMEEYRGRDGVSFLSYREMVNEGDVSDRAFYAQVANGNVYKVPDGKGADFLKAVGLGSKGALSNYRKLLRLPDDLWVKFDEENAKEHTIRDEMIRLKNPEWFTMVNHDDEDSALDTITGRNGTPLKDGHLVGKNGPISFDLNSPTPHLMRYFGQTVQLERSVDGSSPLKMVVWFFDQKSGDRSYSKIVPMSDLKEIDAPVNQGAPFTPPPTSYDVIGQSKAGRISIGQKRRNPIINRTFEVSRINGAMTTCFEISKTGERMRGSTLEIPVSKLMEMELVGKDDFNVAAAREAIMGPDEDEADETEAETDSINVFAQIYKHRRTGILYRVVETRLNGSVSVIAVNEQGEDLSKYSQVVEGTDLKRYAPDMPTEADLIADRQEQMLLALYHGQPVVKNAATRGALEEKFMIHVTDREAWAMEIAPRGVDYLRLHGLIADADETAESAATDETPFPVGAYVKTRAEQGGHVITTEGNRVCIELDYTGGQQWFPRDDLRIVYLLDPTLPDWAVEGAWVAGLNEGPGIIQSLEQSAYGGWRAIVRDPHQKDITVRRDVHTLFPVEAPTNRNASPSSVDAPALDDSGDLPSWARWGATVIHRTSGKMCDVLGTVWAPDDAVWLLRVTITSSGEITDAPVSAFDLVNAPAATPHPALHPKAMSGVICEEQHLIGAMSDLARRMHLDTTLLTSLSTTTAMGLDVRLRKSGLTHTQAHLDAGLATALRAIEAQIALVKRVHAEMSEVLRQQNEKHAAQTAAGD